MKTVSLILILYVGMNSLVFAQENLSAIPTKPNAIAIHKVPYVAKIKIGTSKEAIKGKITGYMIGINDSSVFVSGMSMQSVDLMEIDISKIDKFIFRKKNLSIGRCMLYGAIAGAVVGATLGLLAGDDPQPKNPGYNFANIGPYTAWDKALIGVFVGGIPGAVVGAGFGIAHRIKIPIHGNLEKYKMKRKKMQRYLY